MIRELLGTLLYLLSSGTMMDDRTCYLVIMLCFMSQYHTVRSQDPSNSAENPWRVEQFPNPRLDLDGCGRFGKPSWVCDPEGILSRAEGDEVDQIITELCSQTTCPCNVTYCDEDCQGQNIAVAIFSQLLITNDAEQTKDPAETQITSFANQLRNIQWGYNKECGASVVVVISRKDRKLFTSVGSETTGLSDSCVRKATYRAGGKIWSSPGDGLIELIKTYRSFISHDGCGIKRRTKSKNKGTSSNKSTPKRNLQSEADSTESFTKTVGIIVGVGAGIVVLAVIICCAIAYCKYRRSEYWPVKKDSHSCRGHPSRSGYRGGSSSDRAGVSYNGDVAVIGSDHHDDGHCGSSGGGGGGGADFSGGGGGGDYSSGGGGGGCGSDCGGGGGGCGSSD